MRAQVSREWAARNEDKDDDFGTSRDREVSCKIMDKTVRHQEADKKLGDTRNDWKNQAWIAVTRATNDQHGDEHGMVKGIKTTAERRIDWSCISFRGSKDEMVVSNVEDIGSGK